MMKVDLHVHTRERSACAQSTETAMIESAISRGLDALVFTDHDRLMSPTRLQKLNRRYAPFRIFGGVEVTVGNEHVLVIGLQHPYLEAGDWRYPQLHEFVHTHGGFMALAHPYRYRNYIDLDIKRYPPDAIEGYSWNTPLDAAPRIYALARQLGIPVLANSDAHHVERLGNYYNQLTAWPVDEAALITALRAGAFTCHAPGEYAETPLGRSSAKSANDALTFPPSPHILGD